MSKQIDLSLDEIADSIEKAGYEGFMLYTDLDTNKAVFSVVGNGETMATALSQVFKEDHRFFQLVAASVFACASTGSEMFDKLKPLYDLAEVMSKIGDEIEDKITK